ncbi:unnamed protein product, partial [Didymodactylos carnosus]
NKLNRILDDTKRNIYQTGKESELKLKKWQQENTSKLNNIREKLLESKDGEDLSVNLQTIRHELDSIKMNTPDYMVKYTVLIKDINLPNKGFLCQTKYLRNYQQTKIKKLTNRLLMPTESVLARYRKPSQRTIKQPLRKFNVLIPIKRVKQSNVIATKQIDENVQVDNDDDDDDEEVFDEKLKL